MQCTWRNLARRLASSIDVGAKSFPFPIHSPTSHLWNTRSRRLYSNIQPSNTPSPLRLGGFLFSTSIPHVGDTDVDLSPAQRTRAASHAIKVALGAGNIPDAYHIVNGVRLANSSPASTSKSSITDLQPIASAFSSTHPPSRLVSHTLLHGLIRQGKATTAASLAEQMIQSGMPVRCASLEAVYSSLLTQSSLQKRPKTPPMMPSPSSSSPPPSSERTPLASASPHTTFALALLALARHSRQRRSHRMFKTLLALCLLNGEIILGSLLFGVLLRDWQAREVVATTRAQDDERDERVGRAEVRRWAREEGRQVCWDTPLPTWVRLKELCEHIDARLASPSPPANAFADAVTPEHQERRIAALQALANLAHLLDTHQIPFGKIHPLIQSLDRWSKRCAEEEEVWVPDIRRGGAGMRQVKANIYFHAVLRRLIGSLPDGGHGPWKKHPLPTSSSSLRRQALDLSSYNALLHHTLRTRRSPHLADRILEHMMQKRRVPLHPNRVTMNVVARAGTAMRMGSVARGLLERMQAREGTAIGKDAQDPVAELLTLAEKTGDTYTLNARIGHYIATGRPEMVVRAVPWLLPGIAPAICPAPGVPTLSEGDHDNGDGRMEKATRKAQYAYAVRRAVEYGPYVMTSLLNGCVKAHKTGCAEKVWGVAKRAESASWAEPVEKRQPWCLGVAAYTLMIKLYAAESKKSGDVLGWGKRAVWMARKTRRGQRLREWLARMGTRAEMGREMGVRVYRSMRNAVRGVRKRRGEGEVRTKKGYLTLPRPDARFFNAILDIVARRRGMRPRSHRSRKAGKSRRMRVRFARRRLRVVWEGIVEGVQPDGRLEEVVRDMNSRGFGTPVLVRRLLVGRMEGLDLDDGTGAGRAWLKT